MVKNMKVNKSIIVTVILCSIAVAALFYFLFHTKKNNNELLLYGNVDVREVDISFRIAGQLNTLYFEEGDKVTQGELMAQLDPSPYDSQLEEAIASVKAIEVSLGNAEVLLQRRKELIDIGGV